MGWLRKKGELSKVKLDNPIEVSSTRHNMEETGMAISFNMEDSRPIPHLEIKELEDTIAPGRYEEFANVITSSNVSTYLDSRMLCLAAVIDIPGIQLASYPKFVTDVTISPCYMWDDVVYEAPSFDAPVPAGLSYHSRIVLASCGSGQGTYRRSYADLSERYGLSEKQAVAARDELCEKGFAKWGKPTIHEATDRLTVAELEPLLVDLDIKKSWTKKKKLETLFSQVDHDVIGNFVNNFRSNAFDEVLSIRFPNDVNLAFHYAWSQVVGHFIAFCGYRDRDWNQFLDLSQLTASRNIEMTTSIPDDECSDCEKFMSGVDANKKETWPPFHLGCRCGVDFYW
jgi:hypothetical protein